MMFLHAADALPRALMPPTAEDTSPAPYAARAPRFAVRCRLRDAATAAATFAADAQRKTRVYARDKRRFRRLRYAPMRALRQMKQALPMIIIFAATSPSPSC
jgi:hypothetical protein